jgi:uncharacterized protein (TIRG00374 family)
MKRSWLILTGASLVLSLAIPVVYGGVDSIRAVRNVPPSAILLLVGMIMGAWAFNAARIRLLARALGGTLSRRAAFTTVVASEFAGVATPASAGNPATYILLLSRHGLPVSGAAAVVAVDQLTDLVFFGTAMPIAIVLFALDGGISHPLRVAGLMVGLFVLGVATLVLLLHNYRTIMLLIGRLLHRTPRLRRFRMRLARGALRFRYSVRVLLGMGTGSLILLYLYCLGHWMLRYGVLPVVIWVLGKAVPWGYLFVIQGVLLFLGQVSFLPGGGGGVEIGFSALLSPYMGATATAAALLLWRFGTFYWYLIAGAPVFMLVTGKMAGRLMGISSRRSSS